jgi:hypothetical protein
MIDAVRLNPFFMITVVHALMPDSISHREEQGSGAAHMRACGESVEGGERPHVEVIGNYQTRCQQPKPRP